MDVSPSRQTADLADRFWRFLCAEQPVTALAAGEAVDGDVLFRESLADHDWRAAFAKALLAEIDSMPAARLPAADRVTLALLRRQAGDLVALHAADAHLRPTLFPMGPAFAAVTFANSTEIADAEAARRYVDRLATLPAFLRDVEATLLAGWDKGYRYPDAVVAAAAGAVRATAAAAPRDLAFFGPLRRSPAPRGKSFTAQAERLEALLADHVVPAFRAHADVLETRLGTKDAPALRDAPLGPELYRALVRQFTTTDLEPDALHALGLGEVERLDAEMRATAADAGFPGDLDGFRASLSGPDYVAASPEILRGEVERLAKRIDKGLPRLFGRLPRITYGIESVPAALSERMPPAYAQPAPRDRSAAGLFYVSGLPEKCPGYLHAALTLHEAWPGHLMHIALMHESEDLPVFRRHTGLADSAFLEGWALYCESLGPELGLPDTPQERYGRLDMEMWRALRLVVDTGLHWLGWSRGQAIEAMAARLSLSRATIEGEVDRYIALPGQALAYQVGNLKFRELRARAEAALGEDFRLRDFHDLILGAGALTLPVLEELVDDWIARTRRRAA